MPAMRRSRSLFDLIDLRLPNQRPVGEEPRVLLKRMSGQERADHRIVILLRVVNDGGVWPGVLHHSMNLRHETGSKGHLTGCHRPLLAMKRHPQHTRERNRRAG